MKSNSNKIVLIIFVQFMVLVLFQSNCIFPLHNRYLNYYTKTEKTYQTISKSSNFWELTGDLIYINDKDPQYNWSKTAAENEWCSGLGTWAEPYILENITIDAQKTGTCISIENSDAYFTIRNCTLLYSSDTSDWTVAGIYLNNTINGKITDNNISNNEDRGIFLYKSHNITVSQNVIQKNNDIGLEFYYATNNTIIGNNISMNGDSGNGAGIEGQDCDNNTICHNNIMYNYADGLGLFYGSRENKIFNNSFHHNDVHGLVLYSNSNNNHLWNNSIFENANIGIHCYEVSQNIIEKNTIMSNNDDGMTLYRQSEFNLVSSNTIKDNTAHGIYVYDSSNDNDLIGNYITNNNIGIYVNDYGYNIEIYNNQILNNRGNGIRFDGTNCFDNKIINNNFTGNNGNAVDNGEVSLGPDKYNNATIGNFWGDYTGFDTNGDGIGETIYSISGTAGVQDNYPICFTPDTNAPIISISEPSDHMVFGRIAPEFQITIDDYELNSTWYNLYNGTIQTQNNTFSYPSESQIDQQLWDLFGNGTVAITFYANDTNGNIGSETVIVRKEIIRPAITILTPGSNNLFGSKAPNFTINIDDPDLNSTWYNLNNGSKFTSNVSFSYLEHTSILQESWNQINNGSIVITFYANDSVGNIGISKVTVKKDIFSPDIEITSPDENSVHGISPPTVSLSINEPHPHTTLYWLSNGSVSTNNYTWSGSIEQVAWNQIGNGTLNVHFFANDTVGNSEIISVLLKKDIIAPSLMIEDLSENSVHGISPPTVSLLINEPHPHTTLYWLSNGSVSTNNYTWSGSIEQVAWNQIGNGTLDVHFFANDTVGNQDLTSLNLRKDIIGPNISILDPKDYTKFTNNIPNITVKIIANDFNCSWYKLYFKDKWSKSYIFEGDWFTINYNLWNDLSDGTYKIRVFSNDSVGNIESLDLIIVKDAETDTQTGNDDDEFDIFSFLINNIGLFILFSIGLALGFGIYSKRNLKHKGTGEFSKKDRNKFSGIKEDSSTKKDKRTNTLENFERGRTENSLLDKKRILNEKIAATNQKLEMLENNLESGAISQDDYIKKKVQLFTKLGELEDKLSDLKH